MKHLLKGFKKISEDDKSTTFEHSKGHKITIAHSGLDKNMSAHLKQLNMYQGGEVNPLHTDYSSDEKKQVFKEGYTGKSGADYGSGGQKQLESDVSKHLGGRKVDLSLPSGMAEGGEVPAQEMSLDLSGNVPQLQTPQGMSQPMYQDPRMQQQAPMQDMFGYEPNSQPQAPQELAPSNIELPKKPSEQQVPVKGSIQPVGYEGLLGQQEKGIQQEAQATAAQGNREAAAAHQQQSEMQNLQKHYEEKSSQIDAELNAVANDYRQGHIDPHHFVHSKSGFSQAMTAVGLILGGMGAGLTGGPNQAMDFLNKQIDRDIEGQKMEMDRKHNLVSVLNSQYGNLKDATTLAKAMQADMYSAKMTEAAAQSKSPIAMARAQQAAAQLKLQYEPQIQEMKIRQSVLGGMQAGQVSPARAVPWLVPKEHQAKALEEVKDAEVMNKALGTVTNALNDVQKLQGAGSRLTSPLQSKSQIDALNLQVSSLAKDLFGRVNETELGMIDKAKIGYTDSPQTAQKKIQIIQNIINKNRSTPTLDAFGIKMPQYNTNVRANSNAR